MGNIIFWLCLIFINISWIAIFTNMFEHSINDYLVISIIPIDIYLISIFIAYKIGKKIGRGNN